jgi:hypothetical protein
VASSAAKSTKNDRLEAINGSHEEAGSNDKIEHRYGGPEP